MFQWLNDPAYGFSRSNLDLCLSSTSLRTDLRLLLLISGRGSHRDDGESELELQKPPLGHPPADGSPSKAPQWATADYQVDSQHWLSSDSLKCHLLVTLEILTYVDLPTYVVHKTEMDMASTWICACKYVVLSISKILILLAYKNRYERGYIYREIILTIRDLF
jgi:hypothetical protein